MNMKKNISMAVVVLSSALLFLGTLITNRIQTASVQTADRLAPHEQPVKVSFSTKEMNKDQSVEQTLLGIYSSAGGMLAISGLNFILLSSTLIWVATRKETTT
jgi:predicted membrane GTPase involved in stress response